jgi:hypothetical protein
MSAKLKSSTAIALGHAKLITYNNFTCSKYKKSEFK